eukprot:GFKZ01010719.1.p1 GENE.GFKZ01010719.1~~GFKZ01010719.1.p1  ORF type:complete len:241 (-),score=22.57 GFKZ01010719.1:1907-2566(-)
MHPFSAFCPSPLSPSRSTQRKLSRHIPTCSMSPSSMAVQARVMAWARVVVCGLNLCPFAEQVLDSNTVRLHVSPASDPLSAKAAVADEITLLTTSSPRAISTTLLVLPQFAPEDFLTFHRVCEEIEMDVEMDLELVDRVMLACFHPLHQWGDANGLQDAINFDKRAPYPVINLLRAEQVDEYVRQGRTQHILERNKETLEILGTDRLEEIYRSLYHNAE